MLYQRILNTCFCPSMSNFSHSTGPVLFTVNYSVQCNMLFPPAVCLKLLLNVWDHWSNTFHINQGCSFVILQWDRLEGCCTLIPIYAELKNPWNFPTSELPRHLPTPLNVWYCCIVVINELHKITWEKYRIPNTSSFVLQASVLASSLIHADLQYGCIDIARNSRYLKKILI